MAVWTGELRLDVEESKREDCSKKCIFPGCIESNAPYLYQL